MSDEFVVPWTARYFEVDQQGVVFNAWYLAWFDEAMSRFLADRGLDAAALAREDIDFKLVHADIDWKAGVRWGDTVDLVVRAGRIGNSSFQIHFAVRRGDQVTCQASITYVAVAPSGIKCPVPPALSAALTRDSPAVREAVLVAGRSSS